MASMIAAQDGCENGFDPVQGQIWSAGIGRNVPFLDASVELLPIATARYASPGEIAGAARLPAWTTGTGKRAELSNRPLAHQWKILTLA
jgi:hypothetical protein